MIQEGLEFLSFLPQPPEGFSSFIILPGLSCYSFLLTQNMVTPRKTLLFCSSIAVQFPCDVWINYF